MTLLADSTQVTRDSVIGTVKPPPQLSNWESGPSAFITFLSNIIKFGILLGGIWAFVNILLAGFTYIASGDKPDELTKANQRIYMSLLGLVVLVGSFLIAGVIGYLLYGDATALLSPKIYGPTNTTDIE
ncbi:MAG: pilin [Patescibacteria group bacterium]|jgi:hypothetical protein